MNAELEEFYRVNPEVKERRDAEKQKLVELIEKHTKTAVVQSSTSVGVERITYLDPTGLVEAMTALMENS